MTVKPRFAALGLVILLAIAGCTASPEPPPAPTPVVTQPAIPTATPTVDPSQRSYGSLAELRAALESTGVTCSPWKQDNAVSSAKESGWCYPTWGLSTYSTVEARNTVLRLSGDSQEPQEFLVGPNWLATMGYEFTLPEMQRAQLTLGGTIWKKGDGFPA